MMPMNSNKRKGRANINSKLGRPKGSNDKNMAFDGVYGNSRLMHAAASLVGCVVQVQVRNGAVYEGILRTFSHQFDLVLEMTHKVNPKNPPAKGVGAAVSTLLSSFPFEDGIADKLIFRLSDIVVLKAYNVDADYALKDNFTDTAISKYNGQIIERELEPWEGPSSDTEGNIALMTEEDEGANGWDAMDMFRTNAEKYGVKSSYDNTLHEYTVPLTKKDTEEYKLQEAKAMQIAHEIETNMSYQSRIQLENGDEEDRFSAVVRPDDSAPKYVLPQKRRNLPKRQTSPKPYPVSSNPIKQYTEKPPTPPSFQSGYAAMPMPAVPEDALQKTTNGEKAVEEPKEACLPPAPTVPPRIERRRETERKLAKQKGRDDEIEEFKKFSSNFKLTEEAKEEPKEEEKLKLEAEEKCANMVKLSTLNPNAKEFVFNPKSFTPRSSPQAPRMSPVMAVPQMLPGPLFTAMAPQYVMQAAPVSLTTSPFTAASPRFRKVPLTMQPRHDISPSMHVAAATGQPILASANMPAPSQLTMQYTPPPGVIHASGPPQQAMGYPQMNFVVGPRVMSPQPVGVVPTSHSYCDTSHLQTHLLNKYCIAVSSHPGQHSNHQSQPSPVHQTASQYPPMGQPLNHPLPHGFPQPVVLMQQQGGHHHHPLHMHPGMPQMTIIPTSATAPFHPQGNQDKKFIYTLKY